MSGSVLENAWPPAGTFKLSTRGPEPPIRLEFELEGETADVRLRELERLMHRVPTGCRYLAPVRDFDAAARSKVNAMLGWDVPGEDSAPPTRVPKALDSVVEALRLKGLAADGVAILADEEVIPCYIWVPNKYPHGVADATVVGHYARTVEGRLKARGACDFVRYEREGWGTLRLELWARGRAARGPSGSEETPGGRTAAEDGTEDKIVRVLSFDIEVYDSLELIACTGVSSGLLFCHDGTRRATPSMQFLMAYGLAVDAPETALGVEAALKPGFEKCDILAPSEGAYVGKKQPSGLRLRSYVDSNARPGGPGTRVAVDNTGRRVGWVCARGNPRDRWPKRSRKTRERVVSAVDPRQGGDLARLVAEERYREIRPRSENVADVLSPQRYAAKLYADIKEAIERRPFAAQTDSLGPPNDLLRLCSRALFGQEAPAANPRTREDGVAPAREEERGKAYAVFEQRAKKAAAMLVGGRPACDFEGVDFSFLGFEEDSEETPDGEVEALPGLADSIDRVLRAVNALAEAVTEIRSAEDA